VVNFELPNIPEDYIHRIGRTGRAGASGEAISLVCGEEITYLRDIEKLVGLKISSEVLEGFEPDPNEPTAPKKQQQGSRRPRNSNFQKSKNNWSNNRRKKPNNNRRPENRQN
jgi:ATP-dependent RNA helicase RhlE